MADTVKVAAVGLGWVARHRHLPAMRRNPRFQVVGVVDRTPGSARALAAKNKYPRHAEAGQLADVPWLGEVDAITVATAPMNHHALVSEALRLGKHVLTEKPFCMSVAEGEDMVAQAAAADRRLAVVHNFQFARSTRRLMGEIASGRLGPVQAVDAVQFGNPSRRLPVWCERLPLGLFYDESPHLLYLMRAIAGDLTLARAITVPSRRGVTTPARLDAWFSGSRGDYPVKLSCTFESPVSEWYLMVSGEKRLGIVDVFRDIYISLPNDGTHDTRTVLRTSLVATAQHWLQHVTSGIPHLTGRLAYGNDEVFDRFARGIGGDAAALAPVGPDSALAVLRLQHAIIDRHERAYA